MAYVINKPSVAKYKATISGNGLRNQLNTSSYQLATSAHEIISVLVNGATGAVAVRILDRKNGDVTINDNSPRQDDSFLVQAEASNSYVYSPGQPHQMNNGILVNFEEGQTNATVTILFN